MLEKKKSQLLVEKVLGLARSDETSVSLTGEATTHLRFARNAPSTSGTFRSAELRIESSFGKRTGSVTVNQFDAHSLENAVRRAEEIARLAPEDKEHMPVLGPLSYPAVAADAGSSDDAILPAGVATCIQDARKAGMVAAGFSSLSTDVSCLGTSRGLFAYHRETGAYVSETARSEDGAASGWAADVTQRGADLDFARVSRAAIGKARASRGIKELAPGAYTTILEPACVASLVSHLIGSLDARAADEGRSYFSGKDGGTRLGETLFPDAVNIFSDPADRTAPARPWGEGGVPSGRREWIKNGRVENLIFSRYWAEKNKRQPVSQPTNIIMQGGNGTVEELIASTERGVLVTSLWYIRDVDPRTMLLTGLTRDGVFWIENGKIAHPVHNFRWNDSPVAVLKNALARSGSMRVSGRESRVGNMVVPALKVKQFHFSSISEAV